MIKNRLLISVQPITDPKNVVILPRQSKSSKKQRIEAKRKKTLRQLGFLPFCTKDVCIEV